MSEDDRYWILDFDERDHRPDFAATDPVCIVDEDAGGIIAYAVSEDVAQRIVAALNGEGIS